MGLTVTQNLSRILHNVYSEQRVKASHPNPILITKNILFPTMMNTTNITLTNIESLVEQVLVSRQISSIHQQQLQLILLYDSVSNQEKTLIERVLYGVRHKLLKVVG